MPLRSVQGSGPPAARKHDASEERFAATCRSSLSHTFRRLVHPASSLLWAVFYEALQASRRRRSAGSAVVDAAAITAAVAVVDSNFAPQRFAPGFEERLNKRSLP